MRRVFCLILTMLMLATSISAGAAGITWSTTTLPSGGSRVTATATGVEEGDRIAVATYTDGVFSGFNMAWAEGDSQSVYLDITAGDDTARAFIWEQGTMMPKMSDSYMTADGIMDDATLFSDNQMVNNANAVGYKTITPIMGDYSISFDLKVRTVGDNAIILGDSTNGTIGYGEASAIMLYHKTW